MKSDFLPDHCRADIALGQAQRFWAIAGRLCPAQTKTSGIRTVPASSRSTAYRYCPTGIGRARTQFRKGRSGKPRGFGRITPHLSQFGTGISKRHCVIEPADGVTEGERIDGQCHSALRQHRRSKFAAGGFRIDGDGSDVERHARPGHRSLWIAPANS